MKTGRLPGYILLTLLLIFAVNAAEGREFYKWVDENGVVNFSEQPPPENTSKVRSIFIEDTATDEPADDPYNVAETAEWMQAYRDNMAKRRESQRKDRLERDRIAAQRPVVQYQQVGYRNSWPWYAKPPLRPVHPIEPAPPVAKPYPSVPFRPPGGLN